jgi:hypothetical protein
MHATLIINTKLEVSSVISRVSTVLIPELIKLSNIYNKIPAFLEGKRRASVLDEAIKLSIAVISGG